MDEGDLKCCGLCNPGEESAYDGIGGGGGGGGGGKTSITIVIISLITNTKTEKFHV